MLAQETQAEMSSCPGLWIVSVKLQSLEHILIRTAGNIAEIIDPTFRLLQSSYQQLTQISHHREKPECSHILIARRVNPLRLFSSSLTPHPHVYH